MSAGSRSGVNWILRKARPRPAAKDLAMSVFARPGTSSISRWPSPRTAQRTRSRTGRLPTITRSTASRMVPPTSATESTFIAIPPCGRGPREIRGRTHRARGPEGPTRSALPDRPRGCGGIPRDARPRRCAAGPPGPAGVGAGLPARGRGQPHMLEERGPGARRHEDLAIPQAAGRALHGPGERIEFPRADRFRGDRSDERARLRRAAEDLTPREERNQADEREAEDPLHGAAVLCVV